MADWKIPFGRAKGELITETETANINWALSAVEKKLEEDPNGEFAAMNKRWVTAARAELKRREGGGQPTPKAAPTTSIQRAPVAMLGGSMNNPGAVSEHLNKLASSHHIVSPATTIDVLPPGCGVAVNYVMVDPKPENGEVYKLSDKLGLSGTTLARIGAAAGVDWDASQSGRLDNGSDPHYCHFRAVGHVRNFDGTARTLTGEVEIDAREGSPQIDEIRQKAQKRRPPGDGSAQILELRKFLLRHAESKAKNRAIASMGVKRSYNPAELNKPFAVCRLMWTGETQDPDLKRLFAEKTAETMLGGMSALYGRPAPQPAPAPHAQVAPQRFDASAPQFTGHAPPPLGAGAPRATELENFDEYDFGGDEEEPASDRKPKASATSTPLPKAETKPKPNYAEGETDL